MILEVFALMSTGFILGVQHSFEPDHVAAVSTLVASKQPLAASARIGALWGVGHMLSLLVISILVLLFKIQIPQFFSHVFEFFVGGMLIYLGLVLFKKNWLNKIHIHRHSHGAVSHTHFHSHENQDDHQHMHKPVLIGMVHGLAGSAGVLLLVIASMKSVTQGMALVTSFGVGSIAGMMASGGFIATALNFKSDNPTISKILTNAAATISVGLGAHIVAQNWIF